MAIACVFGAVVACSSSPSPSPSPSSSRDPRSGSTEVTNGTVKISERVPKYFAIDYRVEVIHEDEAPIVTTDEVAVRRPFDGRQSTRSGDEKARTTISRFGRYVIDGQGFFVAPSPPEPDSRPAAFLRDAIDDGYAAKRELRRVAGRLCRVYRIGDDTGEVSLPRLKKGAEEYSDICVDEAGLLLERASFNGGELVRRRIATRVKEPKELDEDSFDIPDIKGDAKILGAVQELEDDSRLPGDFFWDFDDAPKGFEFEGRYSVVPAGQQGFSDPSARGSILAFMSEVWTDGTDVFVIDQGGTQSTTPFETDPNSRIVDVGEYEAEIRYALRESEVRFRTEGTAFVRVRGTIEASKLLEVARSLEKVPGGELRVKQ
jgi:hypothetical protein